MIAPKRQAYSLPSPKLTVVTQKCQPQTGQPMTIAAAFKCSDGLVVCSDTEETAGDYAKVSRPKIMVHPPPHLKEVNCRAVFASSGDATVCDHMMQKLSRLIDTFEEENDIDSIVQAIDAKVLEIGSSWSLFDAHGKSLGTILVGIWTKNGKKTKLLRIDGNRVIEINSNYECAGYGVVLATYLAEKFYSMSAKNDIATIALYIIEAVKTHVPYCGKQTHVLTLSKNTGEVAWHDNIDIRGQSELFNVFDRAMKDLMIVIANPEITEADFGKEVLNFTDGLHAVRDVYLTRRKDQIEYRERRSKAIMEALSGIRKELKE